MSLRLTVVFALCGGCAANGDGDGAACTGQPTVTWDNFGAGFMTQHCQTCHASTAPDRHGAPAGMVFDTEAQVLGNADRILLRATGDAPSMPPQGGVDADDRALLTVWLSCAD